MKGFRLQSSVTRFFKHTISISFQCLDKKGGLIAKCKLEAVTSGAILLLESITFGRRHNRKLME